MENLTSKSYKLIETKKSNPKQSGWYKTDKGDLFFFTNGNEWSCRDDRVSLEYPKWWLEEFDELENLKYAFECGVESITHKGGIVFKDSEHFINKYKK